MKFTTIIGNPPYGTGGLLALKVLNTALRHSDRVSFVLPASFRRDSLRNRVDTGCHLEQEECLPDNTFPRDITTVKQTWVRRDGIRECTPSLGRHADFEFIPYERRDEAVLFIGGAGAGPSGKVKTEGYDHYMPGHHYLVCVEEVVERMLSLQPKFIEFSRICGCLPGIGKSDITRIYSENFETINKGLMEVMG